MGAYLAVPIKTKESEDVSNEHVMCGSSSMQGWRTDQEDAHCCILDFDKNASLFAVFDGHGGFEVAKYAAQHLPSFIKKNENYKNGDYEKALKEAFMEFDQALLTDSVQEELEKLMNEIKKGENDVSEDVASCKIPNEDENDDEENISRLYEEAQMPIQKVIDKYRAKFGLSPCIKPKVNDELKPCCSKTKDFYFDDTSDVSGSSATNNESKTETNDNNSNNQAPDSSTGQDNTLKTTEQSVSTFKDLDNLLSTPSCSKASITTTKRRSALEFLKRISFETFEDSSSSDDEDKSYKGESSSVSTDEDEDTSIATVEDSDLKTFGHSAQCKRSNQDGDENEDDDDGDDDEDEDDDEDDDDEDEDENGENGQNNHANDNTDITDCMDDDSLSGVEKVICEGSESKLKKMKRRKNIANNESQIKTSDDPDKYFVVGNESLLDFDNDNRSDFLSKGIEKPAYNSGCTAVVALLIENTLYVANAGDSRCIICTNEIAEDLSYDHKPEDEVEYRRITNAGGKVIDGRVNHGLNLSRAFGDHNYKLNKNLPSEEQMITAMPDVKVRNISKDDNFIVLACDGIWNSMSSQQVATFVRMHIRQYNNISTICEKMFDSCLAPNTYTGEGEGCDNMTAVIVKLNSLKRCLDNDDTEMKKDATDDKRLKTE